MKRVERQSISSPWGEAWLSLPALVAIHRLGGRIVVNLLRKLFRHLVLVTSTGKHLWLTVWWRFLYQKEKKSTIRHARWERESLEVKKLLHWPQDLALPYFLGLVSYYNKYSSFILSSSSETHSASPPGLGGEDQLHLGSPGLSFGWSWPDAIHFLSSRVLPCGWRCTSLPLPASWTVSCTPSVFVFRNNPRSSCRRTFHHESSLGVYKMLILRESFHSCC